MGHPQSSPAPMEETEKWSSSLIHTAAGQQGNTGQSHSWKDPGWLLRGCKNSTDLGNWWLSGGSYSWVWWWEKAGVEAQAYPLPEGKGAIPRVCKVPAGRGEVAQEGLLRAGKPRRVPRSSDTVQLWRGIQPFDVYIVLQYDSAYLLVVFCLIVQSEALQGNCCFTGRRASTCSLCNAYAPTLTLSSVSVTYNSGSLLFLPHYFGKKITALEKKKEAIL